MMRIKLDRIAFVVCSTLLSTLPSVSQTTTVADVYVQTHTGIDVFSANSAGQLTRLAGSPFADTGQMEGVRSGYLIAVGTNYLRTYHVQSNGAVGGQAGQINTANYGGGSCGGTYGPSLLDHTGQYFSVEIAGGTTGTSCADLQTYKIGSTGQFTFLGDQSSPYGYHGTAFTNNATTYSSNDLFAYGVESDVYATSFIPFRRAAAGDLVTNTQFTEKDPTPNPNPSGSDNNYFPLALATDGSGHLAAVMYMAFASNTTTTQLASYTINSTTGAISSSNTYANMPVLKVNADQIAMSWGGNILAVAGSPGLQLFHFNGAAPATAYPNILLPSVTINQLAWDKNNHLYAADYTNGKLYVFNVTSTGASQASGSPHSISGMYGWKGVIVVPKS